jgi:protein-S-isoprenylcysteine O-methyltransferase Ste14
MSLESRIFYRFAVLLVLFAAMLFIPAGSLKFWQGWAFMALAFIPSIIFFIYFYKHDPQLLERRMQSKEKIREQKFLVTALKPFFLAAFLLPGLDFRFGWSRIFVGAVPLWVELLAQALLLGGYLLAMWVMKVNRFAARTIQVEADQKVISTGPYSVVRHPMYTGSIVLWLCTPLALGSYIAWPAFALLIPFYYFRLLNEEKVLCKELPGYSEYCLRTRFRLIPFIW